MPELGTAVRNVLVVEDDEEDYEFTRDLFAELPPPQHELVWARDYGTAIDAAGRARFDVCLVAMTGYDSDADRARTRDAGFDTHLVKPVDADELIRVLRPAA